MKIISVGEAFTRTNHILGAAGSCTPMAVAEALLLHVYDRVDDSGRERVVGWILAGFDPNNTRDDKKYAFPPNWEISRFVAAGSDEFCDASDAHCKAITEESNGVLQTATKMVIGTLKHLDGDERTMFFSSVLGAGLCPYNFHVSKEELAANEIFEIARNNPNFKKLHDLIMGKSTKRFPSPLDEADYIVTLMDEMARREKVAFMGLKKVWEKNQLDRRHPPIMSGIPGFDFMGGAPIPHELAELMRMGLLPELRSGVRVHVMGASDFIGDGIRAYRAEHAAREQNSQPKDKRSS